MVLYNPNKIIEYKVRRDNNNPVLRFGKNNNRDNSFALYIPITMSHRLPNLVNSLINHLQKTEQNILRSNPQNMRHIKGIFHSGIKFLFKINNQKHLNWRFINDNESIVVGDTDCIIFRTDSDGNLLALRFDIKSLSQNI